MVYCAEHCSFAVCLDSQWHDSMLKKCLYLVFSPFYDIVALNVQVLVSPW